MTRTMTGPVRGGMTSRTLPEPIAPGELAVHAAGRLDTMAEILVQATVLKAGGTIRAATGFRGARFQDVRGSYEGDRRIAAAHRALFSLKLDGANAAEIPAAIRRPTLRELLIAPQARTDLVIRPVNYADQLLETAVSDRVFEAMRATLQRQSVGARIEKSLVVDTAFEIRRLLVAGFGEAAANYRRLQQERGWEAHRADRSGRGPLSRASDREIDRFVERAFSGGASVQVSGPSHYGDLPEIALGLGGEITAKAQPEIVRPEVLDELIETVRDAAASKPIAGA